MGNALGWAPERIAEQQRLLAELHKQPIALEAAKKAQDAANKSQRDGVRSAREAERAQKAYREAVAGISDTLDDIRADMSGPMARAQLDFERRQRGIADAFDTAVAEAKKAGTANAELERAYRIVEEALRRLEIQHEQTTAELRRESDVIGRLNDDYAEQMKQLGMTERELVGYLAAQEAVAEAQERWEGSLADLPAHLERVGAVASSNALAIYDYSNRLNEAARVADEQMRRMGQVSADIADAIVAQWRGVGGGLADLAKRMVDQIIAEFLRLKIIQPILGGLLGGFGGGMAGAGGMMAGAAQSLFGGAFSGGTGASSGGGVFSAASWVNAGRNLWSGFSGMMNGSGRVMPGAGMFGTGVYGPGMQTAFQPSALGWGMAGIAGAYAGYNRYQNTEGGLSGAAAGATYGIGTAAIGMGAMGIASGAGAMAGMAALGPVGWIAAIAMVVDMISGGKLFGTAFRAESITSSLNIGADGGSASASMTEVRNRSLFRGRQWRTSDIDAGDDAQRAADQFFNSIRSAMQQSAMAMGAELAPVIDASIRTVTEYDKKGRATATKILVDYMGRTWEEETAELAAIRLSAEAIIAQVASSAGDQAMAVAERWRDSAESLMQGAQFLVAAQADINRSQALLGEDLGELVTLVERNAMGNESLIDTYQRMAVSTQLLEQALSLAGVGIDLARAEFVQFATDITNAAGGIEQANALWSRFFAGFYGQLELGARQLEVATAVAQSAFARIGYEGDLTDGAGFREAFEALLPSMSPQDVVAWLQAADAMLAVNEIMAQIAAQEGQMQAAQQSLDNYLSALARDGYSEPMQALMALDGQYREHVATIQELAIASGRAEASESELAFARRWHQRQLQQLAAQLMDQALEIANQLGYLRNYGQHGGGYDEAGAIRDVTSAMEDRYARELQLLQQLDQYVRSLGISSVSPLNPTERLNEAQSEYERILALAQAGDLDALAQLQGAAQAYLQEAQGYYGGVGAYEDIFGSVRDALGALVDAGPQNEPLPQPVYGGPVSVEPGDGWQAMNELERVLLAQQLVDHLAALALAVNTPILELMETLGIPIAQLATDLGINLDNITGAAVQALVNLSHDLGLPLSELVEALGLNLPDLADGVRELADSLGYDVGQLINETGTALYDMAVALGLDLDDLAAALGQDLGRLTDVNSPIYQALQGVLTGLPQEQADALQEYLTAIATATTEADATAAVEAAEAAINAMPAAIRNQLAPFFEGVDPVGAMSELDYLRDMGTTLDAIKPFLQSSRDYLEEILAAMRAANGANDVPGYLQGTPFVPTTQMALLHRGEMVIPPSVSSGIRDGSLVLGKGGASTASDDEIAGLRRDIREIGQRQDQLLARIAGSNEQIARVATQPKSPNARAA